MPRGASHGEVLSTTCEHSTSLLVFRYAFPPLSLLGFDMSKLTAVSVRQNQIAVIVGKGSCAIRELHCSNPVLDLCFCTSMCHDSLLIVFVLYQPSSRRRRWCMLLAQSV